MGLYTPVMRSHVFIISLVLALAMVGIVGAADSDPVQTLTYQIHGDYSGIIVLGLDGSGVARIGNHYPLNFSWNVGDDGRYYAYYWFWTVPFTISDDRVTLLSPAAPGTVGTLQRE